jgi:hypothetical protein
MIVLLTFTSTVMWNDIDLYHAVRDFTTDPVTFPGDEELAFINHLVHDECFLHIYSS